MVKGHGMATAGDGIAASAPRFKLVCCSSELLSRSWGFQRYNVPFARRCPGTAHSKGNSGVMIQTAWAPWVARQRTTGQGLA